MMNQIIAAVLLFGVVTIIFGPLIIESASEIFSKTTSVSDVIKSSKQHTGQIMIATNISQQNDTITIFVSNIGIQDITIHDILADGIPVSFVLKDQDNTRIYSLATNQLGVIKVTGTANTIQIITNAGKLFEFAIP